MVEENPGGWNDHFLARCRATLKANPVIAAGEVGLYVPLLFHIIRH